MNQLVALPIMVGPLSGELSGSLYNASIYCNGTGYIVITSYVGVHCLIKVVDVAA